MALRLKYAGIDAELDGRARPRALARRGRGGRRRRAASTRSPPTRRCSSCATCWRDARPREAVVGMTTPTRRDLARRRVRLLRRRPAAVARARRRARGGPVLDLGAGTGRVALDLAAHGHEVVGARRGRRAARTCSPQRARSAGCASTRRGGRSRASSSARTLRARDRADAGRAAPRRRRTAALRCSDACARTSRPGGTVRRGARRSVDERDRGRDAVPPLPDMREQRRLGLLEPAGRRAPSSDGGARGRAPAPGGVARAASSRVEHGHRSLDSLTPGQARGRGARRGPRAGRRGWRCPTTARPLRQHGGR